MKILDPSACLTIRVYLTGTRHILGNTDGILSPDVLSLHDNSPLSLHRMLNNVTNGDDWYQLIFEASGAMDAVNKFVK
jgi:hypothetical protein